MPSLSVLVTCPPMLGTKQHFIPLFKKHGIEVHTPEVVQTLSEEELIELVPQFNGWIIGDDPATRKVFEAGKKGNLQAAVKWGVGVDNVDFQACEDFSIPISNTPNMFGNEVADIALGYIIGLARETYFIDREVRKGGWPKPRGVSLKHKTITVVGFGDIGKQTTLRAKACGMQVKICDPFADKTTVEASGATLATWPSSLSESDFLVFCCALTPDNRHMLNNETLKLAKPGLRVVNVSRGPLIDEAALIQALKTEIVHSAALDVFEQEPLPKNSALHGFDGCIFGSHNASNTSDAVLATNEKAVTLLLSFLRVS